MQARITVQTPGGNNHGRQALASIWVKKATLKRDLATEAPQDTELYIITSVSCGASVAKSRMMRSAPKSDFQAFSAARDRDFEGRAAGGIERIDQIGELVYRFRARLDDHVARL